MVVMERRYVASTLIFVASLLVLSLSIMFLIQQESIAQSCVYTGMLPACYPKNGIAFSIFGFVLFVVLLGSAYQVARKDNILVNRWSLIAMVTALLSYEITEFAYLANVLSPYYGPISQLPQATIAAGYLGTILALLGGAFGFTLRGFKQSRKGRRTPARKRKR